MIGTNSGWIKLHRKFLDSPIWQNSNIARFWTWCLLKATHDGYTTTIGYTRITLEPGQFLYNHPMASMETGLSLKVVRSCLEALQNHDDPEIGQAKGRQTGRHFSIVTILKWRDYQGGDTDEGRQTGTKRAGKGQAEGRLYYKEGKNVKKERTKIAPVDVIWNGVNLTVPEVLMAKYRAKFSRLDIPAIVIDAERWLLKKPSRAAGYKSFDLFLNNWLSGEEEKRRKRDGEDYELTGDSLAAALECARLHGRAANE